MGLPDKQSEWECKDLLSQLNNALLMKKYYSEIDRQFSVPFS